MIKFTHLPHDRSVISYRYGYDKDYGSNYWHNGIDIAAKQRGVSGDSIYSVADGVVKVAQNDADGYGLYVVIEHAGSFCTLYAHLQSIPVSIGQQVVGGQMIGKMGNTGISTGPHLHFEVKNCPYSKFWDYTRETVGFSGTKIKIYTYSVNPEPYVLDVLEGGGLLPSHDAYSIYNMADFNTSDFNTTKLEKKIPINISNANLSFGTSIKKRTTSNIDELIIHHSGTAIKQTPQEIHNQHMISTSYDGYGAAFNFYVRKDGTVFSMRPVGYVTCDIVGGNNRMISICFEGDFNQESLGDIQWKAGTNILAYLCQEYLIKPDRISGHNQYGDASCPGSFIISNLNYIRMDVKNILSKYNVMSLLDANTSNYEPVPFYYNDSTIDYTVLIGDDIYSIAKKFNTNENTILGLNRQVSNINSLMPGDIIKVPNTNYNKFNMVADSTLSIANTLIDIANYSAKISFNDSILANNPNLINFEHQDEIDLDEIGNKKMEWMQNEFKLPGYAPCCLIIDLPNNIRKVIPFLISPSNMTDSRSNGVQTNKTTSGWFVYRLGPNLGDLNISGYMLDTKHEMERHSFLQDYKTYVVDKRTNTYDMVNENVVSIMLEGILYTGIITNLTFSKSAHQQFLYQYNIRFVSFSDRAIYGQEENSIFALISTSRQPVVSNMVITESIVNIIDPNQNNSVKVETPKQTTSSTKQYTVVKGDTMWAIARSYGVTLQQLVDANKQITKPELIYPGQVINIPVASSVKTTSVASVLDKNVRGQTLQK